MTLQPAFQRMEPKPRKIHVLWASASIEHSQDISQRILQMGTVKHLSEMLQPTTIRGETPKSINVVKCYTVLPESVST